MEESLVEEGRIEAFLRREVLPYAPDAWYLPSSVKIGYEISFTRYFHKPLPLRTLEEIRSGHAWCLEARDGGDADRDCRRRRGTMRDENRWALVGATPNLFASVEIIGSRHRTGRGDACAAR